jgi:hypothetical protein
LTISTGDRHGKKIQFLDKYPVYSEELSKAEADCATANDVVASLCDQIRPKPGASLIAVFDHLAHVPARPEGKAPPEINASRHVIFCLSKSILYPLIAAVGPRTISVVERDDAFVISYLEAPMEAPNQLMEGLVGALRKTASTAPHQQDLPSDARRRSAVLV